MKNSKTLKIGLFGGSGRMGQNVETVVVETKQDPYLFVGKTKSENFFFSVTDLKNTEEDILKDVDVWVEFTSPEGLFELIECTPYGTPIVSGSTGLSDKQFAALKKESAKRPLFWASNMSLGLWAFRKALESFSSISNFDFAVEEIHHTLKKDKPGGTALTLQKDLEKIVNKKIETPQAHRLGGIFGMHTVYAASQNELITFQHQALNRKVFAEGAVQAALWLSEQKNGFYSMDDMLSKGVK
ncbi:MAG: 4-hydroxy-tetrahydrodipicolinate reductase [Bdellovibrio sp.]|nr:4-hydroxy-tetrahydrodipicolinate reductase [Bdellovibrio sp.]